RQRVSALPSWLVSVAARAHLRDLHSFPTRRSSDLKGARRAAVRARRSGVRSRLQQRHGAGPRDPVVAPAPGQGAEAQPAESTARSEEHTSELQSRSDLVCRLLLEKKKDMVKPLTTR